MKTFTKEDCMFVYRSSNFKTIWRNRFVIVSVEFQLARKQPSNHLAREQSSNERVLERLQAKGEEITLSTIRNAVLEIRGEKSMILCDGDPNSRSAGSFFMNPILQENVYKSVYENIRILGIDGSSMPAKIVHQDDDEGRIQISAAWLIERAGFCRGYEHGQFPGVALSSRHCLALVTKDSEGASATSLVGLADFIRTRVKKVFGVFLNIEPTVLGSDQYSLSEDDDDPPKAKIIQTLSQESDLDDTGSSSAFSESSSISSTSVHE
eukprot:10040067-Ditylum_brightwellii.AAC.1